MTFQACPGIAQATINVQTPDGDIAQNVLHISNGGSGAWSAADLTTLANTLDTWLTTGDGSGNNFVAHLQSAYTVVEISCRDLTTQAGAEFNKSVNHVGGDSGGRMADGLTKAITLRSGLAGRSYRGRIFCIGLSALNADATDKNLMYSASVAVQIAIWTSLISTVSGAHTGWVWVILSRQAGLAKRSTGVGTAITAVGVSNNYFDYQRRRAPFHGRHK